MTARIETARCSEHGMPSYVSEVSNESMFYARPLLSTYFDQAHPPWT